MKQSLLPADAGAAADRLSGVFAGHSRLVAFALAIAAAALAVSAAALIVTLLR